MRQTELLSCVGILDVSAIEVRNDRTLESFTKNLPENRTASSALDGKVSQHRIAEYPHPAPLAFIAPASLINV